MNRQAYKRYIPVVHWYGIQNQYHAWLSDLMQGDMGISLRNRRPVTQSIGEALSITLVMTITSLFLGWTISLLLAMLINLPATKKLEAIILNGLYLLDTIPLFLLALLLLVFLTTGHFSGILPAFGLGNYQIMDNFFMRYFTLLGHLVLPIFCMTLVILPYLTGQIDRALKEVSMFEYVKTARAKGLTDFVVLRRHILRNALSPLITIFTDNLPALISGPW